MSLSPGSRLGPYEIQAPLGAGGMGEVYKARDTRLDRIVAIKVLSSSLASDPQFRERFEREARTISQLNHPHICTLYDVGEAPDPGLAQVTGAELRPEPIRFLVMEYLEGETLAAVLAHGPLKVRDAIEYATQIASALDAAHRAGVVHRDLKPGNVMLTRSGTTRQGSPQAKLLDFGLAKVGAPAVS
ncbi:MAG: serine/threonine protein kinase, partial [Acidobacteria bacterium]|nr:serine/threonine protein kinase [Acidobacteriota bacterium]